MLVPIEGGLLTLVDGDRSLRTGTLTCSVQVGGRHSDPDEDAVTSLRTTGAVAIPRTSVVVFRQVFHVCTRVDVDGGATLYWDGAASAWSSDPGAACVPLVIDEPVFLPWDAVDAVLCPVLAVTFPPEATSTCGTARRTAATSRRWRNGGRDPRLASFRHHHGRRP